MFRIAVSPSLTILCRFNITICVHYLYRKVEFNYLLHTPLDGFECTNRSALECINIGGPLEILPFIPLYNFPTKWIKKSASCRVDIASSAVVQLKLGGLALECPTGNAINLTAGHMSCKHVQGRLDIGITHKCCRRKSRLRYLCLLSRKTEKLAILTS